MTDSQHAEPSSWLNRYASNYHAWRRVQDRQDALLRWYRPLGLIESGFDNDGVYFEGRADINVALSLSIESSLSKQDLRQRFLYAWAVLRFRHGLLMAKILDHQPYMNTAKVDRCFVVGGSANAQEALTDSAKHLVFTDDYYDHIDIRELYKHAQNVKRIIDPAEALGKLFVVATPNDKKHPLHLLFIFSHTISDALTNHAWTSHFVQLVNLPLEQLKAQLEAAVEPKSIISGLPPAQEDLYPPISGSLARRRWYWAITRILRHVNKPMPAGFQNPLKYAEPRSTVARLEPTYSHLFDYQQLPVLNTYTVGAKLSKTASRRLQRICKDKRVSIGAGCFTLIALVMMDMYEADAQRQGSDKRVPYIVGFPVNPRPFYNHSEAANSLMLAFCDGFSLPFLPSRLGNTRRFQFLVRQTHRNLAAYQKRDWSDAAHLKTYMSSRGAGRVISNTYIGSAERRWNTLPESMKQGMSYMEPQGHYPVGLGSVSKSTNGVSSFGRLSWPDKQEVQDTEFKAVCTGLTQGVRARAGEFLVAIWGEDGRICANVSYDGNAIDETRTAEWQARMELFLEESEYHL